MYYEGSKVTIYLRSSGMWATRSLRLLHDYQARVCVLLCATKSPKLLFTDEAVCAATRGVGLVFTYLGYLSGLRLLYLTKVEHVACLRFYLLTKLFVFLLGVVCRRLLFACETVCATARSLGLLFFETVCATTRILIATRQNSNPRVAIFRMSFLQGAIYLRSCVFYH